jgi:hypothetical protein
VEIVTGDVSDPATLAPAFAGVDVAYYLVHSLGRRDFEDVDRIGAANVAAAARRAKVGRIIYLGGPARPPQPLRRICARAPRSPTPCCPAACRRSCCGPASSSGRGDRAGHAYRALVWPFHAVIFGGMARNIARAAERAGAQAPNRAAARGRTV